MKKNIRLPFLLLFIFIFLALLSSSTEYFSLDLKISQTLQMINYAPFDILMKFVSSIGYGRVMPFAVLSLLALITYLNLKVEAFFLTVSSVISFVSGELAKTIINRPRPDASFVTIYKQLTDQGFPSSHTLTYTVVFGFLFYIALTKLKPSLLRSGLLVSSIFLVLTIGISRIYLGEHWASDVLGGYLIGFFWLILTVNIYKEHVKR